MRVNSAFTGFFTTRLLVKCGIAAMMLAIFLSPHLSQNILAGIPG
jgi:hypothetical protein